MALLPGQSPGCLRTGSGRAWPCTSNIAERRRERRMRGGFFHLPNPPPHLHADTRDNSWTGRAPRMPLQTSGLATNSRTSTPHAMCSPRAHRVDPHLCSQGQSVQHVVHSGTWFGEACTVVASGKYEARSYETRNEVRRGEARAAASLYSAYSPPRACVGAASYFAKQPPHTPMQVHTSHRARPTRSLVPLPC